MLPIIPLVASIVPELLQLFGRNNEAEIATRIGNIAQEITGTGSVDAAAEAIKANPDLALQFKLAVLNQQTELERLAFETEKLYVTDVQDARKYRDERVFLLGVVILVAFSATVALVMLGSYHMLRGGVAVEAGVFAAITGFIGTLAGYLAASAQSVVNYYFGSSRGSTQKTDALADSIKAIKK